MSKLRILSDLHLEFVKPYQFQAFIKKIIPHPDEICILAGDIGNPYSDNYGKFMEFINANFKKSFVIPGNHEYYGNKRTIFETNEYLQEYFKIHNNISLLNNSYEYYDNRCFVGTTLWSHITDPHHEINDVHRIKFLDYKEYNALNRKCIDFLNKCAETQDNMVIITHHMPSKELIDSKYKTAQMIPYNQWFYCDMDSFIEKNTGKINYWIYGHTHTPLKTTMHDIPFICNPIGYPGENSKSNYNVTVTL